MIVVKKEGSTWWARDPKVPGVHGLGPSRKAALADLAEANTALREYLEDKADVAAADKAHAEMLAGGKVYTHAEMLAAVGLKKKRKRGTRGGGRRCR